MRMHPARSPRSLGFFMSRVEERALRWAMALGRSVRVYGLLS